MATAFRILSTRLGPVGIVGGESGLRRVYLPERTVGGLRRRIKRDFPDADERAALLPRVADGLKRYFAGEAVAFDVPLDWDGASTFERAVWGACAQVRYGETATYQELGERVGRPRAGRAVGSAMARNPLPIVVPCHRVLRSDGGLGGYSGPGGVAFKRRLLEMEGAARPEKRS